MTTIAGSKAGAGGNMRQPVYITLHATTAAAFIFLLQRFALGATLESSLMWAVFLGGCAGGLAYMQINR